jgi:hypothetical protein
MARIWKGKRSAPPSAFWGGTPMGGGGYGPDGDVPPPVPSRDAVLDPPPAYYVRVCGFTSEFWSVEQIRHALQFYEQKVHPTSRFRYGWRYRQEKIRLHPAGWREVIASFVRTHHDDLQRWYERLPQHLQENGKREKVVVALRRALDEFA